MKGEKSRAPSSLVPQERSGHKVILDADLAAMYGVETSLLTQAVRRNLVRFPPDFMFQLSAEEFQDSRSQAVMSSSWGGRAVAVNE